MNLLLIMFFDYLMLLGFAALAYSRNGCFTEGENDNEIYYLQECKDNEWDDWD